MNILDKIVADKLLEVELKKKVVSINQLEQSELFKRTPISLSEKIKKSNTGIIAEFKRRSPSKSIINQDLNVQDVAKGYEAAGVCGMSVLTDGKYFGGSLDDVLVARAAAAIPILRKEFIIDEYQIVEAKAFGADVILLIASVLSREELKTFANLAKNLGLDVLLEIHNEAELEKSIQVNADLMGVNNRNLKTFEVSIENSKKLAQIIPANFVKVSESGISNPAVINELKKHNFKGFLIGENFMRTSKPGEAASDFIRQIQNSK